MKTCCICRCRFMSRTTKSAMAVAKKALEAGEKAFPKYAHRFAPKKYTQPQLFAILALRKFFRSDYRGVVVRLREWSELREVLGLCEVPDHSTLCYAERRLLKKRAFGGSSTPMSKAPGNRV